MDENLIRKKIAWASLIAVVGNGGLALTKILAGVLGGSLAVLADGLDSSGDVLISLMTLVTAQIAARPPDQDHPYGHQRADTVASKVLAFFIFFLGAQLAWSSLQNFLSGQSPSIPQAWALGAVVLSILGKFLLAWNLFRVGKQTGSQMLRANGKNMQADILISSVVLIGSGAALATGLAWLDPLTAGLVGLWVMKTGWGIFKETSLEVMDGLEDTHLYKIVFTCAKGVPGIFNPHRARIRKFANSYLVEMDLEVEGNLTVREAHDLVTQVESKIREALPEVYDIMIHMEPKGRGQHKEKYGLTQGDLEEPKDPSFISGPVPKP